jgi:mycothiol synthase
MVPNAPAGFSIRGASVDDAELLAELINDCTSAEVGLRWTSVDEMRDDLTAPGRDVETDDVIAVDAEGAPAGYLQLWRDIAPYNEIGSLVYVRPRYWGHGLSTFLLRLGEERARTKVHRAPSTERVVLQVARFAEVERAAAIFEALGFTYARTFWMMRIDLADAPPSADGPAGIRIRQFEPTADAPAVHSALTEAFADHWGHAFPAYEQWRHYSTDGVGAEFDPGLWFLAVDGDEVVGAACCRARTARDPGAGQVNELAVRRRWRERGIGLALLLSAFGELHRRGIHRAELSVDAESQTGATRLYERAGMHVAYSWEVWEGTSSSRMNAPVVLTW